jgi:hypothetical protein
MKRPKTLKLFMVVSVTFTFLFAWGTFYAREQAIEGLIPIDLRSSYYPGLVIMVFVVLSAAYILLFIGVWVGNRLFYVMTIVMEMLSLVFYLYNGISSVLNKFWFGESLVETFLLLLSARFFFGRERT